MTRTSYCSAATFAMLAMLPIAAQATSSLEGLPVYVESGVNFSNADPFDDLNFLSQSSAIGVIGPQVEGILIDPHQTFDFSEDGTELTIHINTGFGTFPFNGFRIELTDTDAPNFTGFNILSNTFPGMDASRISLQDSRIALNFSGLSGVGDIILQLDNDQPGSPILDVAGTCPGPANLFFERFTPGGTIALLKGTSAGTDLIPAGPCAGDPSGLNNLQLHALFTADPAGNFVLSPNLPLGACGRSIQALDLTTCEISPVTVLP
jgi:hypothetical protein